MKDLNGPVTAEDHIRGDASATVTLVEYGDYQCPHCRIAHGVVQRLQKHFGGQMRFVYRNFPLLEIHPMAEPAAEAAEYAAAQDRFWEMHDAIFDGQQSLSPEMLVAVGEDLDLDGDGMAEAIEGQQFAERIKRDLASGERAGVHGTPTFFINGQQYSGNWEYGPLRAAIELAA